MKNTTSIFTVLCVIVGLLMAMPSEVKAQFTCTTNARNRLTITGYTGPGGALTIPDTINGLPVISIGDYAFQYNSSLTSVTIGTNVRSIGFQTFDACPNLASVTLSEGITSIGDGAFENNPNLTEVTIPNSVTYLGSYAFNCCYALTNVIIPDSISSIGIATFCYCGFRSIVIPASVNTITNAAFEYCYNLTTVFFEGSPPPPCYMNAFPPATIYCLPSATGWGSTFDGCRVLLWDQQSQLGYTTADGTITIDGYAGTNTDVSIPSTINVGATSLPVTVIGTNGVWNNITKIRIPDSVTSIMVSAFNGCKTLTNVTIGNAVTNIADNAFYGCSGLTSVTIGNAVTSIGDNAFYGCSNLTGVAMGNAVTSIGESAFYGCSALTGVAMGAGVTSIGDGAFYGCSGLANIAIPQGVTNIGFETFFGCGGVTVDPLNQCYSSLAGVLFDKNRTTLIRYVGEQQASYSIPEGVTTIAGGAFEY